MSQGSIFKKKIFYIFFFNVKIKPNLSNTDVQFDSNIILLYTKYNISSMASYNSDNCCEPIREVESQTDQ